MLNLSLKKEIIELYNAKIRLKLSDSQREWYDAKIQQIPDLKNSAASILVILILLQYRFSQTFSSRVLLETTLALFLNEIFNPFLQDLSKDEFAYDDFDLLESKNLTLNSENKILESFPLLDHSYWMWCGFYSPVVNWPGRPPYARHVIENWLKSMKLSTNQSIKKLFSFWDKTEIKNREITVLGKLIALIFLKSKVQDLSQWDLEGWIIAQL